jgi:hypothetical protein
VIVDIQKGSNFKPVLDYHFQKIEEGTAKIIDSNLLSEEKSFLLKELESTRELNSNTNLDKTVWHTSLNLPKDEKLNEETFRAVAKDYMNGMGFNNNPYVTFLHEDKDHQHVHILASRVDFEGKAVNYSMDRMKSFDVKREVEQKHGISETMGFGSGKERSLGEANMIKYQFSNALDKAITKNIPITIPDRVKHELNQLDTQPTDKELKSIYSKIPNGQFHYKRLQKALIDNNLVSFTDKQILSNKLSQAYNKANSKSEYKSLLDSQKIYYREMKGSITYGLDNNRYFNESKLSPRYSLNSINNIENAKKQSLSKRDRDIFASTIKNVLKQCSTTEEFKSKLSSIGIDIEYHSNSRGIYGASFSSNTFDGTTYKASDIDRDLSWSKINDQLNYNNENKDLNLNINESNIISKDNTESIQNKKQNKNTFIDTRGPWDKPGSEEELKPLKKKKKKKSNDQSR